MDKPVSRIAFPLALVAAALLLAACGNKGPLTHVSEPPPVVPMESDATVPADALPADALPDTTPPEQPPATDVVVPPPSESIDETPPPPETGDDGG